jgi:hypothetical protein
MEYPPEPDLNDDLNRHKHLRDPTFVAFLVLVGGEVDNDSFLCRTREPSMLNWTELVTNASLIRKGSSAASARISFCECSPLRTGWSCKENCAADES